MYNRSKHNAIYTTLMSDFVHILTSSIDVSPSSCVSNVIIAVSNDELEHADQLRYERFFRVWVTEPPAALKELTVVLRSNTDGKQLYTTGLDRFIDFMHTYVPIPAPIKFTVYNDKYTIHRTSHALLETMSQSSLLVGL